MSVLLTISFPDIDKNEDAFMMHFPIEYNFLLRAIDISLPCLVHSFDLFLAIKKDTAQRVFLNQSLVDYLFAFTST